MSAPIPSIPACAAAASQPARRGRGTCLRVTAGHWYALAGLVIVLDQISKWFVLDNIRLGETIYVAPFWNWVLTFNPGAAFSFLADQPGWQRWFFTVLALAVSALDRRSSCASIPARSCSRWR